MTSAGAPVASRRAAPRRKSVLFCPTCGHESAVDGDWSVRATPSALVYECPDCETVLAKRPQREPGISAVPVVRAWTSWLRFWTPWLDGEQQAASELTG